MTERILDKSDTTCGFAARVKGTSQWLSNKWPDGVQAGPTVPTLTGDRTKMSIDERKLIEIYCIWYNNTHAVPVDFEIVEVSMCIRTVVDFAILPED